MPWGYWPEETHLEPSLSCCFDHGGLYTDNGFRDLELLLVANELEIAELARFHHLDQN